MAKRYREEAPRIVHEGERLHDLARRIVGWVSDSDRKRGTWIAGVWGGRGSGKTSLLLTVLDLLHRGKNAEDDRIAIALPRLVDSSTATTDIGKPAGAPKPSVLFAPSHGRDGEDLLFALLDYLEDRYTRPEKEASQALAAIREAEARKKDQKSFFEYEKEVATSSKDIWQRFVDGHSQVARTTRKIHEQFGRFFRHLQPRPDPRILLCIDDLDLRPDRTLDMLEALDMLMRHDGLIVLIAADRDLMLHSVHHGLHKRGIARPGLAAALLSKLVPYGWGLPVPAESERLEEVWHTKSRRSAEKKRDGEDELPEWWPAAMRPLLNAEARRADPRLVAAEHLAGLLPPSYRGLTEYHNRLLSLRGELPGGAQEEPLPLWKQIHSTFPDLGFHPVFTGAAVSAIIALDVRYPELGFLEALRTSSPLLDRATSRGSMQEDAWVTAVLRRLDPEYDPPAHKPGVLVVEAVEVLDRLRRFFTWLRESVVTGGGIPARFIAVSVDSDALGSSKELWEGRFQLESEVVHLDLHAEGFSRETSRSAEAHQRARARLDALLRERRLRGMTGSSEIVAQASLPLLVWLGWTLQDENPPFFFWNRSTAGPLLFESRRIPPQDRTSSIWFHPGSPLLGPTPAGATHAIVLFDVLGRSDDLQLGQFVIQREPEDAVQPLAACRLAVANEAGLFEPKDLEPALDDLAALLEQLKRRGIERIHLGICGLDAVAFFVGRQLNGLGMQVSLYERTGVQYLHVFDLEPRLT